MVVDDVLMLQTEGLAPLRAPIMVVALRGLFDMSSAATAAVAGLVSDDAVTVAEIDPDPFFDFTQERPMVEIEEGELRVIRWPDSRFEVVRTDGPHDLVIVDRDRAPPALGDLCPMRDRRQPPARL